MAYVELQHNAAGAVRAMRGVWMTDMGGDADLPGGGPRTGSVPEVVEGARDDRYAVGSEDRRARPGKALSEATRNRLAVQLRAMYDTVAQQPVPDRFADLIAQLDRADRNEA